MNVLCASCGQEVSARLVSTAVCPCSSRCFQWDDGNTATYEVRQGEALWNGQMAGKRRPSWSDRQGFRRPKVAK